MTILVARFRDCAIPEGWGVAGRESGGAAYALSHLTGDPGGAGGNRGGTGFSRAAGRGSLAPGTAPRHQVAAGALLALTDRRWAFL